MAQERYISPSSFVLFKETGIVPTIPDPASLRKFHADFLDTDIEIGSWARNIVDGKLYYRNETEIQEFDDDLFGPNVSTYHNHDNLYVKLGEGGDPVDLNDWFELVNAGLADEYLRCKKPFAGDYEIQAWSDVGQFPPDIWESMPVASTTAVGGFQLDNDATHFYNGTGNWVAITSGTFDHAGLQHLAYADSGHTGFSPTVHDFIDTTNHPVSGLTDGHFLRALSATTYGFEAVDVAYITGTPANNQIAVWTNANTLEGTAGITYDGTTFAISGNITATGEISAFTGDPPASWWGDIPSVLGSAGDALIVNATEDGLEWGTAGSGMSWPASAGIANYSGSSSWSTSYSTSGTGTVVALTASPTFTGQVLIGTGVVKDARLLTLNTNGIYTPVVEMPYGGGLWIADALDDTGYRIKLTAAENNAYFDYYQNLHFRSGVSASYTKITFTDDGAATFADLVTASKFLSGISNYGFYTSKHNNHLTQNAYYDGSWKSYGSDATYGGAVVFQTSNGAGGASGNALAILVDNNISAANEALSFTTIFTVNPSGVVTWSGGGSANANTAFGWGNHASAGYQAAATAITTSNISSQSVNYAASAGDSDTLDGQHGSYYATQGQSFYLGTTAIAINRGSGAISLTGITSIDGTAASTPKLLTTNFTIEESGGKLIIKYGATTIGSISSAGYLKMKDESEAFTTP